MKIIITGGCALLDPI